MKRPHWYPNHPPACTCVQCNEARLELDGDKRRDYLLPVALAAMLAFIVAITFIIVT